MNCSYCGGVAREVATHGVLIWYECLQCGEKFCVDQSPAPEADREAEE